MATPQGPYEAPSVGYRLTAARHARGISLGDAERQTRIARRFLQAMESDQFDVLPAPVYARGFLRNYARFLGLDENEMVSGLRLADREPSVLPVMPPRSNAGVWIVAGAAFGLGVLLWAFLALGAFSSIGDIIDDIGGDSPAAVPTPIAVTPTPAPDCDSLRERESLTEAEQRFQAQNCATPTPEPAAPAGDRTSCEEIRGTEYRSQQERSFFLGSCLTPPAGG